MQTSGRTPSRNLAWMLCWWVTALISTSSASADVLHDLTTQRHWIGYAPRHFNPNIGMEPTQNQIRADLQQLYDEGWRSLYTYTLDGVLQHAPRIAKEVGFDYTLAGVFFFDEAQLAREKVAAQAELAHIDGFIVGNEGLLFGRYSPSRLIEEVAAFQAFGKPVTTTEVSGYYSAVPELLDLGDFAFYNSQPWFDNTLDPADPVAMAETIRDEYFALQALRPDRTIVIKESWFPSAGPPNASEANQVAFFEALATLTDAEGENVLFAWGEAYDQPWKSEQSPFGVVGPHWGFHTQDGTPKLLISELQDIYTSPVPSAGLAGDYNGDGMVNLADYTVWRDNLGATEDGNVLGGNGNGGTVDSTDYALWRVNMGTPLPAVGTTIPEPGTGLLLLLTAVPLVVSRYVTEG